MPRAVRARAPARLLSDALGLELGDVDFAGLPHVTLHTLRRSFASLAARRGVDPVQAARMTAHSLDVWARTTGDYGKPRRDEARERMLEHGSGAVEERSVVGQSGKEKPV